MDWGDYLTAGGGVAAVVGLIKFMLERVDKKRAEETVMVRELTRRPRVLKSLRKVVRETGAARALVCVARNGGKQPNPASKLTSTVCENEYEFAQGQHDFGGDWKEQPLTEWYIGKLVQISKDKMISTIVADIPECDPLRLTCEAHGIMKVRAYEVCSRDGEYYYFSIHFADDRKLDAKKEEAVRVCVGEIREAYRECFKTKSIFRG